MEENETLRRALEREAQVSASLKVCSQDYCALDKTVKKLVIVHTSGFTILQRQNEQKNKENAQLVEELAKIKKEKSNLSTLKQQLKEMEHLKVCGPAKNGHFSTFIKYLITEIVTVTST